MTHKQKVSLARKMRTRAEELAGIPIFQSIAWETRRAAIRMRVNKTPAQVKPMAPAVELRWFEQWMPLFIARERGYKLKLRGHIKLHVLRMIHFLFFRKSVNPTARIKTA